MKKVMLLGIMGMFGILVSTQSHAAIPSKKQKNPGMVEQTIAGKAAVNRASPQKFAGRALVNKMGGQKLAGRALVNKMGSQKLV